MLRARGNHGDGTRCDGLPPVGKDRLALALDKEQYLIVVRVRLLADLTAGRHAHQHHLGTLRSIKDPPEIAVFYCLALYVSHIWLIRYVHFHSKIVRRACEGRRNFIGSCRHLAAGKASGAFVIPLMTDTAPALAHILSLLQRETSQEEYDAVRAQWFAHVDNEEKLFVPHTDEEGAAALDAVLATFTDDGTVSLPTGEAWHGIEGAREFYEWFLTAFDTMVWSPKVVVIGPQGVADIAEMTATQRKKFGPLDQIDKAVRVLWVIYWPWDPEQKKFAGEQVHSLQYLPLQD